MGTARRINESYDKILKESLEQKQKEFDDFVNEGLYDDAKRVSKQYKEASKRIEKLASAFKPALKRHMKIFNSGPDVDLLADLDEVESELARILDLIER